MARLDAAFDALYAKEGRPLIAPARLIRASLLQMLFSSVRNPAVLEMEAGHRQGHARHQLTQTLAGAVDLCARAQTLGAQCIVYNFSLLTYAEIHQQLINESCATDGSAEGFRLSPMQNRIWVMKIIVSAASLAATLFLSSAAFAQDKYTVALDGTFAPHAMPKLGGGIEGFNVDLANLIGERLGAEMDIVATQFSGILPGLQAGTYDFVVAPTTITEERADNLLFSEGYLNTDFLFLVGNDAPEITDMEEFEGKVIAVNKGSAYDSWARDLAEEIGWTVESYGTNTDAVQAVVSGRAFANVAGNTVSAWAAQKNPNVKPSYLFSTGKVWGMPFRKDDVELRNTVEMVIECLKIDGTIAELHEKWFGLAPAEGSAAVTPVAGFGEPGYDGYVDDGHEPSC